MSCVAHWTWWLGMNFHRDLLLKIAGSKLAMTLLPVNEICPLPVILFCHSVLRRLPPHPGCPRGPAYLPVKTPEG
jgi:hypothetical protein